MVDAISLQVSAADPIARCAIYRLLAQAFRYPTPEVFASYQSGDFLSELGAYLDRMTCLEDLADSTAGPRTEVQNELLGTHVQDFQVEYTRTFDAGAPEPPCPPYEGTYRPKIEKTAIMLEVSEFYNHFGLKMNPEEDKRELPDHLSAELEFMHFLAFKEAQARDDEAEELLQGYLRAQRDFLVRHLAVWVPTFTQKLKASNVSSFYVLLANIALQVITCDLELLNTELGAE